MIACLFGRAFTPFVESAVDDLCDAVARSNGELVPIAIEDATAHPGHFAEVERLYVLPFDAPVGVKPADLVRDLFPQATPLTSFAAQNLCADKLALAERLIDRGVPQPAGVLTSDPAELRDFVKQHEFVLLKEHASCAGQGHLVLWLEDGELYADGGSHRYRVELVDGGPRRLTDDVMRYPAPFFAQRLVGTFRARHFTPGQQLRAYIVDNELRFWTERHRDRYTRPSDWIVDVSSGAKYRFVLSVSEEVKKLALRTAEVVGARVAAVDIVRSGSQGPMVVDVETDGHHAMIDRQFKTIPEYRDFFDLDHYIARALLRTTEPVEVRAMRAPRHGDRR